MKYDFETLAPAYDEPNPMWDILKCMGIDDPEVIMLGVAEMKFRIAPALRTALEQTAKTGFFGYALHAPVEMTDAVCNWFARRHNWTIAPEHIVQTTSVVASLGAAITTLSQPGDGVLILSPCYGPFRRITKLTDRRMVDCPLRLTDGRWELDLEDIEAKAADPANKVLLLCSPHNPTGCVWTREELTALGEICLRHGLHVVSDEIHCDLVFAPRVNIPFASISPELAEITVTSTSPSKGFNIAGLTIGNVIISDPDLRERVATALEANMFKYINTFGFAACTAAYRDCEPWLDELHEVLRGNADYFRGWMAEHFPAVTVYPLEGTYLQWADFSCFGSDPEARKKFLVNEARFFSDSGVNFGPQYGAYERINLACPRRYLTAALDRLAQAADC